MANILGKTTGSLVNYVVGNYISIPQVGMGATLLLWSDRHAYTIHKVEDKKLWASADIAKRIDMNGMTESQDYDYYNFNQEDESKWELFTLRKDGRWHKGNTLQGNILSIGTRQEYYDFSF